MSKMLVLAVRALCALAESEVEVKPATLFSWDKTREALIASQRGKPIAEALAKLPAPVRDRVLDYVAGFEPLVPEGESYAFGTAAQAQTFAQRAAEAFTSRVDFFNPQVVNVRNLAPDFLAPIAAKLEGVHLGNALHEDFEHVDHELPGAMLNAGLPAFLVETSLLKAIEQRLSLEEAIIATNGPEAKFAGRLASFVRGGPRRVGGVEMRLVESMAARQMLDARVYATIGEMFGTDLADKLKGKHVAEAEAAVASGAETGTPSASMDSGISRDQPDTGAGQPATSQNGTPAEPKGATNHVPAQEQGSPAGIAMPDGTPIPEEVLRDAFAKMLQNLGTQIQNGTVGGKPGEPKGDGAAPPADGEKKPEGEKKDPEAPKDEKKPAEGGEKKDAPPAEKKDEKPPANEAHMAEAAELKVGDAAKDYAGNRYVVVGVGHYPQVKQYDSSGAGAEAAAENEDAMFAAVRGHDGNTLVFVIGDDGVTKLGEAAATAAELAEAARAFLEGRLDLQTFITARQGADFHTLVEHAGEWMPGDPVRYIMNGKTGTIVAPFARTSMEKTTVKWDGGGTEDVWSNLLKNLLPSPNHPPDLYDIGESAKNAHVAHVAHVESAGKFTPESLRVIDLAPGVKARVGRLREGGKVRTQALTFAKDTFTEETARAWVAKHIPGPTPARRAALAENGDTWICPACRKPEVRAAYLGWRSCDACGWEERRPMDLDPAEARRYLAEGLQAFKAGDAVKWTAKFLKSTGSMSSVPGRVVAYPSPDFPGARGADYVKVQWSGSPEPSNVLVSNIMRAGGPDYTAMESVAESADIPLTSSEASVLMELGIGASWGVPVDLTASRLRIQNQGQAHRIVAQLERGLPQATSSGAAAIKAVIAKIDGGWGQIPAFEAALRESSSTPTADFKNGRSLARDAGNAFRACARSLEAEKAMGAAAKVFKLAGACSTIAEEADRLELAVSFRTMAEAEGAAKKAEQDEKEVAAAAVADAEELIRGLKQAAFSLVTSELVRVEAIAKAMGNKKAAGLAEKLRTGLEELHDETAKKLAEFEKVAAALKNETKVAAPAEPAPAPDAAPAPAPAPAAVEPVPAPAAPAPAPAPAQESLELDRVGEAVKLLTESRKVPGRIARGDHYSSVRSAILAEAPDLDHLQVAAVYDRLSRMDRVSRERAVRLELSENDRGLLAAVSVRPGDAAGAIVQRASHGPAVVYESELVQAIDSLKLFGEVPHRHLAEELARGLAAIPVK